MVSPIDKGANEVNPTNSVQASQDGARVLFSAPNAFPGAGTSTIQSYFLAARETSQWVTDAIEPPLSNWNLQIFFTSPATSEGLEKTLQSSTRALAPGAVDGSGNIYIRDNITGERTLVTAAPRASFAFFTSGGSPQFGGATPDFETVLFQLPQRLTDDAVDLASSGATNVYEWSRQKGVKVASILPDGTSDPLGSLSPPSQPTHSHGPISDDGRRITFVGTTTNGLYLRENDQTIAVSASQRTIDPGVVGVGTFVSMTSNGSQIFFTSPNALTDDATGGGELYRYDVDSGRLDNLTVTSDPAGATVRGVLAVDDAGGTVYFVATSVLAPGASANAPNLYIWSRGQIRFIAALDPALEFITPGRWAMSPNGKYFAFRSFAQITSYDNLSPTCRETIDGAASRGVCSQVFLYSTDTDSVSCVSCNTGSPPASHADLSGVAGLISQYYGRAALDDGRVFFNTGDRLAPEDTNGRTDVYEWDGRSAGLISSGQSDSPSTFADASADGNNVFFFTAEQLVAQDVDQNIDVYDARVGGGLAAQNQRLPDTSCEGAGCQGSLIDPPALPILGSIDFSGTGNAEDAGSRQSSAAKVRISARKAISGTAFTLSVRTPGRGRVTVRGAAVRPSRKAVTKGGLYKLRIALTARAKKKLVRTRRLTVVVRVTYVPTGGRSSTASVTVTFKSKGRA